MFGKMMNSFYYGKSGKGDYRKEDLPTNRWQLFWEMLRVRFSALMRLNLLYMLVWLPAMIVLLLTAFGMLTGLFWYAFGAEDGTLSVITFTIMGILAGWLCDNLFARRFLPALALSLGALLLQEGAWFLLKYYLEAAPGELFRWVPITAGLSLLTCPVIYLLAKLVRKAGGNG